MMGEPKNPILMIGADDDRLAEQIIRMLNIRTARALAVAAGEFSRLIERNE